MAYVAACSLLPQTAYVTLDLQTNNLILPSLTQTSSQSWKLWSPEAGGPPNFTTDVRQGYFCIKISLQQFYPGSCCNYGNSIYNLPYKWGNMLNVNQVCCSILLTFWKDQATVINSVSDSVAAQNSPLYTLTPNQLQQSIEQLIAAKIWMGIS